MMAGVQARSHQRHFFPTFLLPISRVGQGPVGPSYSLLARAEAMGLLSFGIIVYSYYYCRLYIERYMLTIILALLQASAPMSSSTHESFFCNYIYVLM